MKISTQELIIIVILAQRLFLTNADNIRLKTERKAKTGIDFQNYGKPRFISFDAKDGNIDINWDVTIPFLSIPLNSKNGNEGGGIFPLLNVNTKGISVVGLLVTLLTLIVPILSKPKPGLNYRFDDSMDWNKMGNAINDVFLTNDYVAPCVQQIICSVISAATQTESPSSIETIIDRISSQEWFKDMTNGTAIQDAVTIGRSRDRDCSLVYKNCLITPALLRSAMRQMGITSN